MPNPSPIADAGPRDAGQDGGPDGDGGEDDGGGLVCPDVPEQCNDRDDDCDGHTDEDADRACEMTVVNAVVRCGMTTEGKRCIPLDCLEGFTNCDGEPANGCEPYCSCHVCEDAGTEDGGS